MSRTHWLVETEDQRGIITDTTWKATDITKQVTSHLWQVSQFSAASTIVRLFRLSFVLMSSLSRVTWRIGRTIWRIALQQFLFMTWSRLKVRSGYWCNGSFVRNRKPTTERNYHTSFSNKIEVCKTLINFSIIITDFNRLLLSSCQRSVTAIFCLF